MNKQELISRLAFVVVNGKDQISRIKNDPNYHMLGSDAKLAVNGLVASITKMLNPTLIELREE